MFSQRKREQRSLSDHIGMLCEVFKYLLQTIPHDRKLKTLTQDWEDHYSAVMNLNKDFTLTTWWHYMTSCIVNRKKKGSTDCPNVAKYRMREVFKYLVHILPKEGNVLVKAHALLTGGDSQYSARTLKLSYSP